MRSPRKPGLASLFSAGVANIDTQRCIADLTDTSRFCVLRRTTFQPRLLSGRSSKLFEDLEKRALTEKEEKIIAERVALQRSLLQQFEAREKRRKVSSMK